MEYVRTYVRTQAHTDVRTHVLWESEAGRDRAEEQIFQPDLPKQGGERKKACGREGERGERAITDTHEDDAHTYVRTCVGKDRGRVRTYVRTHVRTHVEGVRTYVWHVAAKREGAPPG